MTEALQVGGSIAATALIAAALLLRHRRLRAAALALALAAAAALVTGEGWGELEGLQERPAALAAVVAGGIAAIAALAAAVRRRPLLLPLLLIAALPFRVPVRVDGVDANLLLPLYAVIAAGALAVLVDAFREADRDPEPPPRMLLVALAAVTVLYALQSVYSSDIPFAARNVAFFLVPFAAMFVLLSQWRWSPRLLALALAVVAAEAALFAVVGVGQAVASEIFWNPALERSNEFHFYFRVNSLFWDPNIYGRYLALAMVLLVAALAWTRRSARIEALAALLGLLLVGLFLSYSQTSFIALLAGTAVICALRWSARWTAIAVPVVAVAVFAAVLVGGGTSESEDSAAEISSGRTTLIEGGLDLAADRPALGHGSASFAVAFAEQEGINPKQPAISHNELVTVAAEQGAAGLLAYLGFTLVALWTLLGGLRSVAPGLGAARDAPGDPAEGDGPALAVARMALLAAFAAMLVHTIGYAGYLTDPLTWTLLAIGGSLAAGSGRVSSASRR